MRAHGPTDPPTRTGATLAYAISALTTLLWLGCVLPAGRLAGQVQDDLAATPMQREKWLLVPALLLLIIGPTGFVLSRTRAGRLSVLAGMDAFVALYAGLWFAQSVEVRLWPALGLLVVVLLFLVASMLPRFRPGLVVLLGVGAGALAGLLALRSAGPLGAGLLAAYVAVGLLSTYEAARVLRAGPDRGIAPSLRGVRLAVCTLALLAPAWLFIFLQDGRDMGSFVAPFAFIAVSAAGATLTRAPLGLRLTGAILQVVLAAHVLITLRYTVFDAEPRLADLNPVGRATLALAALIALLALLQALWLALRHRRLRRESPEVEASPAGA